MLLQCDPTVIYALMRAGTYDGNIRRDDLQVSSPYNTYRVPGLPPGPIAAPGKESIAAAAHPADTDYLYFVSRNDGSHEFARTLEEHNRNVQKFQVQYLQAPPPLELRAQHLVIAARRRADQAKGVFRRAHDDAIARLELKSGLPVEREEHFVAFLHVRLDADDGFGGDHDGTIRQRVRRDRRQHDRGSRSAGRSDRRPPCCRRSSLSASR